jgi:hypothetical protein
MTMMAMYANKTTTTKILKFNIFHIIGAKYQVRAKLINIFLRTWLYCYFNYVSFIVILIDYSKLSVISWNNAKL